MRLTRQSTGQPILLDESRRLGSGGEAHVYPVSFDSRLAAKIYHQPTPERAAKLDVMVVHPPDDPPGSGSHTSIAWPVDLIVRLDGPHPQAVVGFAMPHVRAMRPLFEFYNPSLRKKRCPLFDYRYLHRAAANLAAAVNTLHSRGYVIGDMNESNILIADTALVTLIDTDSFQVTDPESGQIYRCMVGKPEYTPPELQGITVFGSVDRTLAQDRFGLAVLIFRLLMEGTHPFDGRYKRSGDAPQVPERIREGHFPYGARGAVFYECKPTAPEFKILHPTLRQLFQRCFYDGHRDPDARPDAAEWRGALEDAVSALVTCQVNAQHLYGNHLSVCPWCERARQLRGVDAFPSEEAIRRGVHLRQPPARIRSTASVAAPPPQQSAAVNKSRSPILKGSIAKVVAYIILFVISGFVNGWFWAPKIAPRTAPDPTFTWQPTIAPLPTTKPSPAPPENHKIGDATMNPVDGAQMVYVPSGEFTMGSDTGDNDEKPAHRVYLDGYWIYKTPVTVAQYARFCQETGHAAPDSPGWAESPNDPVVNVSWDDAAAYATWARASLPTEAQWEKAARGTDGRVYPWGNQWNQSKANTSESNIGRTEPVDARPTAVSPYGLLDMAGNVLQWCFDGYDASYYPMAPTDNPTGPTVSIGRVARGGSWNGGSLGARVTSRSNAYHAARYNFIGFRLVAAPDKY